MKKLLLIFLLLPLLVSGAEIITVTVTVTNAPIGNTNTLVLNGNTRTFTNTITASPGTLIQETNSRPYTATNIINHLTLYTFGAGFGYRQTSPTNVLITGTPGTAMSASLAGLWGTISYSTQSIATPTYTVRVPHTNEASAVRTNIASGLANYLNLSTNAIATNATALSNYVHRGAGPQQVIRTSLQVTQLNGMISAVTNGYWTNGTMDKPQATNMSVFGGFQSFGSGALTTQIGSNATASGLRSTSIGIDSKASGTDSTAVGYAAIADTNATSIGRTAFATNGAFAGGIASAGSQSSIAINSGVFGVGAISLNGEVNADYGVGVGYLSDIGSTATNGVALGPRTSVQHSNSVALAADSTTTASNQIRLGTSLHTVSIPGRLNVEDALTNNVFNGTNIWRGDISYPPITSTSASTTNVLATGTNVILRVTGTPGAAWTLAGIAGPNRAGLFRILYNDTGYTLTIGNEAGTAPDASTRIRTMTGADVSTGTNSVCQFFYDENRSRWVLISHNP